MLFFRFSTIAVCIGVCRLKWSTAIRSCLLIWHKTQKCLSRYGENWATRIELQRQSENSFRLTDNAGTTGKLVIVEQNCDDQAQNRIVMYAEGAFEGRPFNRPIKAQCVLLLRSGSMKETNGRDYVAVRLDSFIRIDRTSIKLLAKALHPLVGKTADRNFSETLQFISSFSQAAETRPETIKRLVTDLPHISLASQQKLIQIAYQCGSQKSTQLQLSRK